jgi:hypothetical protein
MAYLKNWRPTGINIENTSLNQLNLKKSIYSILNELKTFQTTQPTVCLAMKKCGWKKIKT